MKQIFFILSFISFTIPRVTSQTPDPDWGIKFTGYAKTDIFYDTRQSSASNGLREGHFYLFPDNALFDNDGNDINANPSFHILNIQTRFKGDITAPDAFKAKTSGYIEAEFFGANESELNGFRLRHALVRMDWDKTTLLIGQFWHPLFPSESFPGTISFNTGAPFLPFSRNPQVRLTRMFGKTGFTLTAYSQRDFSSAGPEGTSNRYLRNSGLPGLNFQMRASAGQVLTGWAGVDYKKLRPELRTSANYETNATIGSVTAFTTFRIKTSPLNLSMMAIYGQNSTDLMMLGGYAVAEVTDQIRLFKRYTNLNTASFWMDMGTTGEKVSVGLFAGYSKNLGSKETISGSVFGRGNNIDHLFRLSPRILLTEGRFSFAMEVENTVAAYGTMQTNGKVTDTDNVNNLRILVSTIYRF